jgi:hypothetical protein
VDRKTVAVLANQRYPPRLLFISMLISKMFCKGRGGGCRESPPPHRDDMNFTLSRWGREGEGESHWKGRAAVQNTEYREQNKEYRIQITEYRIQNTENRIQNTENRIQNTKYRIQSPLHSIDKLFLTCIYDVSVLKKNIEKP